jgi:hypothetical protein
MSIVNSHKCSVSLVWDDQMEDPHPMYYVLLCVCTKVPHYGVGRVALLPAIRCYLLLLLCVYRLYWGVLLPGAPPTPLNTAFL